MNEKCRAKDPSKCWRHGNQQGIVANQAIKTALAPQVHHGSRTEVTFERPLKIMSAPRLAVAITGFTKDHETIQSVKVRQAILDAAELHKNDLRTNRAKYDVTPYIEHPLRNTLRIVRFGCEDQDTIIGSVLHDTVEDHPFEISEQLYGVKAATEEEARDNSFKYIRKTYGPGVERIVRGMSNPIVVDKYMPAAQKNAIYAEHVKEAIEDPQVCVAKVSDFIDNAVGLYHNQASMSAVSLRKKSTKYLGAIDHIENRLKRGIVMGDLPVTAEGAQKMLAQIQAGRKRLLFLQEKYAA